MGFAKLTGVTTIGPASIIGAGTLKKNQVYEIPFPTQENNDVGRVLGASGFGWAVFVVLDETPQQWSARTGFALA